MKKAAKSTPLEVIKPASKSAIVASKSEVIPYAEPSKLHATMASMSGPMSNIEGVTIIRWLEAALPVYERSRSQLATQAVMMGYALICVRDFAPRGSLACLLKMQAFSRSVRTLNRCIKVAQIYAEKRGLLSDKGQLAEVTDAASLFHPEFDFGDLDAHPLSRDIADYVGDSSITALIEAGEIGGDDPALPPTGPKKRPLKETAQQSRDRYQAHFKKWSLEHTSGHWRHLYLHGDEAKKNLSSLDLERWLEKAFNEVRDHNRAESAKERHTTKPKH